ncbi:putative glucosidase 2 subunit beta precursor [Phaeomoniella chlamydospora]|uniref:Glucosidase 2 subunit beta n=1 Tax=Phaeomoniella chlamydospora TaxID=158046 RepID=A0A0G2E3H6_PHACM|nr:putative glucosidase 2 subunit beta precursor [Phaeomoniella chlamydospora]
MDELAECLFIAKFYKDFSRFSCISLPSITVPASAVNDDYCDCPDGSDEPEPQNLSAPALPGFYCKNKGHIPAYLPSLAVNDGKCDYDYCCDGSDEWAGIGGVHCPDKCKEIGKEWRKQDESRKKALGVAVKRRKELVSEAARLRGDIEHRIATLEREVKEHETKVAQLGDEVLDLEQKEKFKIVKSGGKGSKTSTLANLAKQRVEELRSTLTTVREQRDAQRARVQELEAILSTFKEEYNPNFNDEGVKRAVRSWEDYAAKEKEGDWQPAHDRDLNELVQEDNESQGINWAEWETGDESEVEDDVAALYNLRNYLPPSVRVFLAEKIAVVKEILITNGILAPPTPSDTASIPESPALSGARSSLSAARSALSSCQNSLSNTRSDLDKPFGPDDVFRSLKDTCVEVDSGEYVYKHCYFSKITQRPKKGGGETNMGKFEELTTIPASDVDAALDPEDLSSGPNTSPMAAAQQGGHFGPNERIVLSYANGQGCWNGPARSAKVILGCSEKEVLWRIRESEKCVYEVWAGSSAVCPETVNGNKKSSSAKDEL